MLKGTDVAVLLKLQAMANPGWSYQQVATEMGISPATVHESVNRLAVARLYDPHRKEPIRTALAEFLIHGFKYVFPAIRGSLTRGMPTGFAAPNLLAHGLPEPATPPVWIGYKGEVRGYSLMPLYKSLPMAAQKDQEFYRLVALTDALRDGNTREQQLAAKLLREELGVDAN